jgi:ABC-2 type transport system permease protein
VLLALATLIGVGFGSIGAVMAARTGRAEAVQGLFPLLFVTFFLSSINLPRELIEIDWFRTVTTVNPVSYLVEGMRSLVITGWDATALLRGFGVAACSSSSPSRRPRRPCAPGWRGRERLHRRRAGGRPAQPHRRLQEPGADHPRDDLPARVPRRLRGRALERLQRPRLRLPSGYTSFQFVFVFLQSAAFGGVFTGFAVAADYESGFARRLMLAAPNRTGLIAGYVITGIVRYLFTAGIVTVAGLLAGMQVDGGASDLGGLLVLGIAVNVMATLFGVGLCMRTQSMQSVPFLQIPVFITLFLAPVYVPRDLLEGWIATVAPYNPATAFLEAGRGFISGRPDAVALAALAGGALLLLLGWYALHGLRKAERSG